MSNIPIFGVLDSQGSAETLARRGGITNYHLIAYSFSNISAKNYQNWLMCIEVITQNVIVVFLRHSVLETTGPIFTKILHNIAALLALFNHAYTRHYPIPFLNAKAISARGGR